MALYWIHGLMTLSILCFYFGYFYRNRNNAWHRAANSIGVLFNLSAAVYLLLLKYLLGGIEVHSIYPVGPPWVIHTHRFFAAVALLQMLVMAFTGWTRKRNIHVKLHYIFLPLYTLVYISGLFLFQTEPL